MSIFDEYKAKWNRLVSEARPDIGWARVAYSLLMETVDRLDYGDYAVRKFALNASDGVLSMLTYMLQNGMNTADASKLYWKIHLYRAPWWFESYLIYLERDRLPQNKFYEPKRKQLNKHGLIQAMQDLEDDKLDILSISMPPGTQKTTLEKFFASWVMGRHLSDYSLFYSHSGDITRMFYDGVLDIITNDIEYRWREIFPNAKVTKTDAKREQINLNDYKPFASLQTSSVGSKNAGKVRCNRYLFCDDLIGGIEEALSKPRLDKLWNIYSVDARQRKLNEKVKEIHIATRWSVYDVIGRLKDIYGNSDRARFISVPDIDPETGESNFDYDYNGMSTQFFHDQEMVMDEISYKCLYKNEPIEREGLLYHEADIKRYLELPLGKPDAILSIADTKNKGTDYFAQPVLLQYGDDYYMDDAICSNESDYEIQYARSTSLIIRNKVEACHFESNNGGDRVAFEVNKRLKDKDYYCNVTQEYTTANKETKIIVYAPWVKQHIYFKDKSLYSPKDDYGVFMSQVLSYSVVGGGRGQHDDCVDVLASFAKRQNKKPIEPSRVISSPF